MVLMRRMEDSGVRLIYDCRLSIVHLRSAPHCGGSQMCYLRSEAER